MATTTVTAGLWRNGEYVRYRAGRVVSILGSQISGLALPLLVLSLGGSAVEVGLLTSCALVTKLASQLPAGYLADRFRRRELMIITDLVRVIAYASIPLAAALSRPVYAQLMIIAIVDGAGAAVFSAAATAALRDLVPPAQIARAVGQTQVSTSTLALVGPVLGGLCFAVWRMLPFVLDASSYLLSAVLIATLASRPAAASLVGDDEDRRSPRLSAGLRWIWDKPLVMRMVAFAAVLNLAAAAVQLMAIVGLHERGTRPAVIGIVLACSGIGLLAGAAVGWRIVAWLGNVRLYLACGMVWTLGLLVCATAPTAQVLGPVLALLFFLCPAATLAMAKVTLTEAPAYLLGRVTAASQLLTGGLAVLGPVVAGVAVRVLGISPAWALLAALCLIITMITVVPRTRGTGSEAEA
jgi:MFS family permease